MPRNLTEPDRKKNQFDKDERVHLLSIMKQYAPLLDSSASTIARKKIWTTIEEEFKQAGFTRKTSAQLKKYWQNYKYHCKKSKALGKENKKGDQVDGNDSSEWNRYQIFVESRSATNCTEIFDAARPLADLSQIARVEGGYRSGENDQQSHRTSNSFVDLSRVKTEEDDGDAGSNDYEEEETNPLRDVIVDERSFEEQKEIVINEVPPSTVTMDHQTNNHVVVSNAKISDSTVTVSVIYPENVVSSSATKSAEIPLDYYQESRNPETAKRIFEYESGAKNDFSSTTCAFRELVQRKAQADASAENASSQECELSRQRASDSSGKKQVKECSNNDRCSTQVESEEGDTAVRATSLESRNDSLGPRGGYVFLTDYTNQLKHKLLLQQLETEEKRLKVKIAEMTIQEVQLRIKALKEEMCRTEELHRVRVATALARAGHSSE